MKKNTARGKVLLSQIKNTIPDSNNIITIKLTYPLESFRKRVYTISNFFKVLSNGKNTLHHLGNNREFFKKHRISGCYYYQYKEGNLDLMFFISSEKKINELELKSRITKILKPATMEITYNDPLVFTEYFTENIVFESGFQFFGSNRTNEDTFHSDYLSV